MRITTKGVFILFLIFFSIQVVSAELLLGQTKSLYNLGDEFEISIKISPNTYVSNFLIAKLICSGHEIELYKSPHSVMAGEEKEIIISTNLDNFLTSGVEGDCFIKLEYGGEEVSSQKFEVTGIIRVTLSIQGILFSPGQIVNVHGQAEKANGELLKGFVEVSTPGIESSLIGPVTEGEFDFNFTISENAPSGSYTMTARAYEKDAFEEVLNEGEATSIIRIKQIIKEIDIALNDQSVSPKEELTYNVLLYDQARERAEADVSITVYKPNGEVLERKIVKAGETNTVHLEYNSPPGYWGIEARIDDLETKKEFLVEELMDLSFTLENNTLIVENIGNIPYNGPVEISIGGINEIKDIGDLAVEESKKFKLLAPDGEYKVEVGEGSQKQDLGTTFLTGKAISVQDIGSSLFGNSFVILIGLILILIIALIVVYIYKRISRKRALLGTSHSPLKKMDQTIAGAQKDTKQDSSMIDKGEKQESAIVSLKLKNILDLNKNSEATKSIDSALWKAKEAGAKIYSDSDYRIMIFAPVLTKQKDNSLKAILTARSIERILNSHNRRHPVKIKYGIGVNSGTLIVESKEGKFKFMSLNNIVSSAKRISEQSTSEVLISEELHRKSIGRIKVEKLKDKNLWKIEKVIDRTAHADYVKNLTEKHKKIEKRKKA
ncbi:MAG: hypothetical protein KKF39_00505 [Nanoarchaeota archaeon]|nr:hypothetical protein [Nanoarchaeota archaeon]